MNFLQQFLLLIVISVFQLEVEGRRGAGCAKPKIENGRVRMQGRGKMVYYRCRKKFTRIGAKFSVCLPTGKWSREPAICIGKGCPPIEAKNGLQISEEYNGAMLKYTCPAGMKRKGPESIYCNGREWSSSEKPTCVGNRRIIGISLECDFEEEELCGWSQSDQDDFEWTWFSGTTPTVNTGPPHDHTLGGDSKGHYLFIEASTPRKPQDTAILASPLYQAKYSDTCFEFWYHMQGPDQKNAVGSLEVYIKPESVSLDDLDPDFFMEGNQGEGWIRGSLYIKNQTEVFQIIIKGTRKEAYVSDIAIDDVRMYNCSEEVAITSTPDTLTNATSTATTDPSWTANTTLVTSNMTSTLPTKTVPQQTTAIVATTKTSRQPDTTPPATTKRSTSTTKRSTSQRTTERLTTAVTTNKPTTTQLLTATTKRTTKQVTTSIRTRFSWTTPKKSTAKSNTFNTTTPSRTTTTARIKTTTAIDAKTTITAGTKTMSATKMTDGSSKTTTTTVDASSSSGANSSDWQVVGSGDFTETITWNYPNDNSTMNYTTLSDRNTGVGEKIKDSKNMTPLIVGVSCGIVVAIVFIGLVAYFVTRRNKDKLTDESLEEMAPITSAEGGYYHPG